MSVLKSAGLGAKFNRNHHTATIVPAIWCLVSLVFIHGYVGTLASLLSVPKLKPIIRGLEDLPDSGLDWVVRRGTELHSLFLVIYNNKIVLMLI